MSTDTLTAAHTFTASAEDRRRCTCGKSRNTSVHGYDKAARAAAKAPVTAEQVRTHPVFAELSEGAREVIARHAENPDPRVTMDPAELAVIAGRAAALDALPTEEAPLAVITLDGTEETVQAAPTSALSAWGTVTAGAACTPAVLPSQARKAEKAPAARGRKVEPNTRALWVARELVAIILDSTDPAHAVIVRKLSSVIPNNRGGRTIRLTVTEAELLSGIATEIETAVLETEADGAGRLARSCVTMRARLAALWA